MAQLKKAPDPVESVAPFAKATRTKVLPQIADHTSKASDLSPARRLQADLEAALDPGMGGAAILASAPIPPRLVTAGVVTICLAFWGAVCVAASALF